MCDVKTSLTDLEHLTKILRLGFVKILGDPTLRVLEHLMLMLLGDNMYRILCQDPQKFYIALTKIYGRGADPLLKSLFLTLVQEGLLDPINPSEIIIMIKTGDKNFLRSLLRSLVGRGSTS